MTNYSAYQGETGPSSTAGDSDPYTMGIEFAATSTAWLTKIHWWQAANGNNSVRQGALYKASDGSVVASAQNFPATVSGWNTHVLPTPVALTVGEVYIAAVLHPSGGYSATSSYYATGAGTPTANFGPLRVFDASSASNSQNVFHSGNSMTFPEASFGATKYWLDVTITDVDPNAGPTAPVVNAGSDASVTTGTLFSRTASESNGGATINSRAWTIVSGPSGSGTTIGTSAGLSWTPSTSGTYVLQYAATNSVGTGTDSVSIIVADQPSPPGVPFGSGWFAAIA